MIARSMFRRRWPGYVLDAAAALLLVAVVVRYQAGYIPKFFVATFLIAAALVAIGAVAVLARPSGKSMFDFLLVSVTAGIVVSVGLTLSGCIPPGPEAVYKRRLKADLQVYADTLPGDVVLFLEGFDKSNLRSFEDLGVYAGIYAKRWRAPLMRQGFTEGESKAISLMLFTSTLWAFGNA